MKHTKKLLSLLLVLCLVLSLSCTAFAAGEAKPLDGKTVILHSNDVHGAIDLYAAMASLKADYEAQGAEVILADAGDYSQGTVYVSVNKGADAVTMMNATGYDVATIGNHEFDYGYAQLAENMKAAKFKVLCADVLGADGHFSPLGSLDRAQLAQVFCSFYEAELDQVLKMTPDTPEQPSTPTQIPTQVLKAA